MQRKFVGEQNTLFKDYERVIMGTKVILVIKRMQSKDEDQTWKTDTHNKENKVTKIIHTK